MGNNELTTAERKELFISVLGARGTISSAARAAGVARRTCYDWCDRDEEFRQAVDSLREETTDRLEQTAVEYALDGYTERRQVLDASGDVVWLETQKRDPNTLKFLLASRRREIYGPRQEIAHTGDVTIKRIVWSDTDPEDAE